MVVSAVNKLITQQKIKNFDKWKGTEYEKLQYSTYTGNAYSNSSEIVHIKGTKEVTSFIDQVFLGLSLI